MIAFRRSVNQRVWDPLLWMLRRTSPFTLLIVVPVWRKWSRGSGYQGGVRSDYDLLGCKDFRWRRRQQVSPKRKHPPRGLQCRQRRWLLKPFCESLWNKTTKLEASEGYFSLRSRSSEVWAGLCAGPDIKEDFHEWTNKKKKGKRNRNVERRYSKHIMEETEGKIIVRTGRCFKLVAKRARWRSLCRSCWQLQL
jgi:hypothetical protein